MNILAPKVSYDGVPAKELKQLVRQFQKAKEPVRCELGHERCGATSEPSQDGQAPCARELLIELAWRGLIPTEEINVPE